MCLILEAKFGGGSLETNYFTVFLCIRAFFGLSQADLLPYLNLLFLSQADLLPYLNLLFFHLS